MVPRPDGCPDAEVGRASRALACWVVTDAVTGSGGDRHRCVRRAGMLGAVVRRGVARATWLPAHAWCPAGVTAAVAGGCSFVHAQQAGPRALCSAAETEVAVEETGKKAAMKRWMQRRGVSVSDVPRVITTFYIAKNVVFVAGLGLCIKVQPLRRFFQSGRPQRLKLAFIARYPNFYSTAREKILSGAERLAASRFFRPLPEAIGTKPKAFALALAENMVLFKLTFPIHAPITLLCVMNYYARPAAADALADSEATAPAASAEKEDDARGDSSLLDSLMKLEDVTNTVHVRSNQGGFGTASSNAWVAHREE